MKNIGVVRHWGLDHLEPTQTVQMHLKFKIYYKTCIWGAFLILWKKKFCPSVLGLYLVKRPFLVKRVQKITNKIFFFIKSKMLPICNFYNKFSILASSDPVEWVPDGPVPHGAQNWLGRAVGGQDLEFSWSREFFMSIRSCCRALKWYISKFGPDVPP